MCQALAGRGAPGSLASQPLGALPGRSPAQERVFQIFSSKMTMAAKWDKSPVSRKMFMMEMAFGAAARARRLSRQQLP